MRSKVLPSMALVIALVTGAACGGGADDSAAPPDTITTTTVTGAAPVSTTTTTTTEPVADPSTGCGTEPDTPAIADQRPGDVERTFEHDGVDRVYRLGVPTSYDPAVATPLVMNLHGSGSNAVQASVYGDVPAAATQRGFITVTPQAVAGQWTLGLTDLDSQFLVALLDDISNRYCVDGTRVHLIGMSQGAWKSAATACGFPGRFASIALVTVEVFPGQCEPMPVVAFHGTADPTVPYGEGSLVEVRTRNAGLPGAKENIANWAASGGCDTDDPVITEIGDDVERLSYDGCNPGVGAVLYTIHGGGHTWPGSPIGANPTTRTIDATEISLDWFRDHPAR